MEKQNPNKYIAVMYKLYALDGEGGQKELIEETAEGAPFVFVSALGMTLDAFEAQIAPLALGQEFDFTLASVDAYGDYEPSGRQALPRSAFEINGKLDSRYIYEGAVVPLSSADGARFNGTIVEIGAESVTVDLNHPLAGKKLPPWKPGEFQVLDARPSDPAAPKDHKALRLICRYGAYSFGGWSANPKSRTLPGKVVKITGWSRKGNEDSWGMGMNFQDANTNSFSYGIPAKSTNWEPFEFVIPETVNGKDPETGKQVKVPIKFPIKLESISQNNWGDRNNPEAKERILDLYDLRVHTDMGAIPVDERPYEIGVTFPTTANCFYYKEEEPVVVLSIGSWLGEERTIRTKVEVESATGEKRPMLIPDVKVLDSASVRTRLPFTEPGAYTLRLKATGFAKDFEKETRYAVILHPPALTEKQKDDSAYGINVHGGAYVGYEKFAKLGFVWVRDYAFNFLWMVRARGDGKYAGWPWYPKIIKAAEDVGMRTLPCLMNAAPGRPEDPDTPDNEWRRQIALIVSTFPQLTAFELDNEHGWPTTDKYGEWHRVFAEIVKACRPDALSVQEGCGAIVPEGAKKHVLNGNFKDLKVLNGHRYAGMVGPEISRSNFNVADIAADEAKIYQRDLWRQWKINSELDGVKRQRWITEWGWDTRAGQIVSASGCSPSATASTSSSGTGTTTATRRPR